MNIFLPIGTVTRFIRNVAGGICSLSKVPVKALHSLDITHKLDQLHCYLINAYAETSLVVQSNQLRTYKHYCEITKPFAQGFFGTCTIVSSGSRWQGAFSQNFHQAAFCVALIQITDSTLKHYPTVRRKMKEIANISDDRELSCGNFDKIAPHSTYDKNLLLFSAAFMISTVANIDMAEILNSSIPIVSSFNLHRLATQIENNLSIHSIIGCVLAISLLSDHIFSSPYNSLETSDQTATWM